MIASFRHGFIFIKSKKTGGTSVEAALSQVCGPDDIVAPLGVDEEAERGFQARNFTDEPELAEAFARLCEAGDDQAHSGYLALNSRLAERGFAAHLEAGQIRARLAPAFWDGAHRFTIERHPYEKAVSQAYFAWSRVPSGDFATFLEQRVRKGPYHNARFYMIGGEVVADVLRYEHLEEDLARVCAELGLPALTLPRLKAGHRHDRRPAAEILSDDQKAVIYERCKVEFDLLGYTP